MVVHKQAEEQLRIRAREFHLEIGKVRTLFTFVCSFVPRNKNSELASLLFFKVIISNFDTNQLKVVDAVETVKAVEDASETKD